MKKLNKLTKRATINVNPAQKISQNMEKIDLNLECIDPNEREDLERKLKDIDNKIEDVGKICDSKKTKSYEDYNNVLKSNKSQILDELTKLNFKLIEAIKQNTREDFLNKLQKDLAVIKGNVSDKDKELQNNNKILYDLENKISSLQDEKEFYSKEMKKAKKYNMYLQYKLTMLENKDNNNEENNNTLNYKKNESSINETINNIKLEHNKFETERKEREGIEKLNLFFTRNEEILNKKIQHEQKKIKEKYEKFKKLESFENPIFQILNSKYHDYQFNMFNSKISNQDVFFNNKSHSNSEINNKMKNSMKAEYYDLNLSKNDKKEIMKLFLDDPDIKRYIYELLYESQS